MTTDTLAPALDLAQVVTKLADKALAPFKISTTAYRTLRAINAASEGLTPGMLAALVAQEPHSMSGILRRLEARGLIRRRGAQHDRRVVWFTVTDGGRALVTNAEPAYEQIGGRFLVDCVARDFAVLEGIADRMRPKVYPEDKRREALERMGG